MKAIIVLSKYTFPVHFLKAPSRTSLKVMGFKHLVSVTPLKLTTEGHWWSWGNFQILPCSSVLLWVPKLDACSKCSGLARAVGSVLCLICMNNGADCWERLWTAF